MSRNSDSDRPRRSPVYARLLACLLALALAGGASPPRLRAAFDDEKSDDMFTSYEKWAASEGGKALLEELEKRFWGDEETEAFVNKIIDWGNTKSIPGGGARLGKVVFLADSELKSKASQYVSAFGSLEKLYGAIEIVDRISAGELYEVMQDQASAAFWRFVTNATTEMIPVFGQLKLAYDIAKVGYDAFLNEIYDLNVQQLYRVTAQENLDWSAFQGRLKDQLGFGDAAMDQFIMEFGAKNGAGGLAKQDFVLAKQGDRNANRAIDTVARVLFNKFQEQRRKELAAEQRAKAAKAPLEDAAWVMAYLKKKADVDKAVKEELKKQALAEFEKQKAAAEKWSRWRDKEKALAEEEAKARASTRPEPLPSLEIPFDGFQVPDPKRLVDDLNRVVAAGGAPGSGSIDCGPPPPPGVPSFTRCITASSTGQGPMAGFMGQLAKMEQSYFDELGKVQAALEKRADDVRAAFEMRKDAAERQRQSCLETARTSNDPKVRAAWSDCHARYDDALHTASEPGRALEKEWVSKRAQIPKLDLRPLADRYRYWSKRYENVEAAAQTALAALEGISWDLSPAQVDASETPDRQVERTLSLARSEILASCSGDSPDFSYCVDALRVKSASLKHRPKTPSEDDGSMVKGLQEFREALAKTVARRGPMEAACQSVLALTAETGWLSDLRAACKASTATFGEKVQMAAEVERTWQESIAVAQRELQEWPAAEAKVAEFWEKLNGLALALETASQAPWLAADKHPYDWVRQLGAGSISMTYLPGLDAGGLAALRAEVSGAVNSVSGWGQELAPGPYAVLTGIQAGLKSVKPVPQGALVHNDALLTARDFQEVSASAGAVDPGSRHATSVLAGLRRSLQDLIFSPQDLPEKHPVTAAYHAAVAAVDSAEARVEQAAVTRAKTLSKKAKDFSASVAKLKGSAAKPSAQADREIARLKTVLQEIEQEVDAAPGKIREESRVDAQELMRELMDCEAAFKESAAEKTRDMAWDKLRDIEERMQDAGGAAATALLNEAGQVAQKAGIGGAPEVVELMGRLSSSAHSKGAGPSGKGAPAEAPGDRDMRDALDDFRDLERDLAALAGGPASQDRVDDLVERAARIRERASEKLSPDRSGRANPNLRPVEDAFSRFKKDAEDKKLLRPAGPGQPASADAAAVAARIEAVRSLYRRFAVAFAAKDLSGVLDCLTEDWESAEGTALSDMEKTLGNSFQAFDSITLEIQNLQVRPEGGGNYAASYGTHMVGQIRQNDIRHEEKSTHQDTVVFTKDGPRIQRTTGGTAWIQ